MFDRSPSLLCVLLVAAPAVVRADILHESATLSSTGRLGGLLLSSDFIHGSRFHLDEPAKITRVGGHMSQTIPPVGNQLIFAAIVRLTDATALPQGQPFDPEEVLAWTTLRPNERSSDIRVALPITIPAGDYGVVFGAGLYGTTGRATMSFGGTPLPPVSRFFWGENLGEWREATSAPYARFVVEGVIIPEPTAGAFLLIGLPFLRRLKR